MKTLIHILFLFALYAPKCFGGGLLRENFEAVRAMGMGGAFVALADDANAIWLNPSALAYVQGNHFNLIDTTLGVDSLGTLNKFKDLIFNNDSSAFLDLATQWVNFKFKPTFVRKNFGFSLYTNTYGFFDTSYMSVLGVNIPNADVYAFNDIVAVAALGIPVTKYFAMGINVRGILRTAIDVNVTAFDLLGQLGLVSTAEFQTAIFDYLKTLAGTGYGIGLTLSAMGRVPLGGKGAPTLSVAGVVEDVGQTTFAALGTPSPPPSLRPNYITGAAITWPWDKWSTVTMTAELRHMFEPIHFGKMASLGVEYRHRFFALRGGLHQGDWTAGASWELLPHTRLHFSIFSKELGDGFRERLQRWYLCQLVIGFRPY